MWSGKWSQMVPMMSAKPPAERDATPGRVGSTAHVGGFAHPFLERRKSSRLLAYFETTVQAPFSLVYSRCPDG